MSSTSSLAYWLDIPEVAGPVDPTAKDAKYLSYNIFLGLSLFGGFFGLDHLYLRSPLTCILKTLVNINFLGSWWIYDVFQAFFNREIVKVFGLNIPGYGPFGIGAGCLIQEKPDKKHMAFFIYGLSLFVGGFFGLDSFILDDSRSGIIRILMVLSMFLMPVSAGWWTYDVFMFLFKTTDVTGQHYEYFGAPKKSMSDKFFTFFPSLLKFPDFFKSILGPLSAPIDAITSIVGVVTLLIGTFSKFIIKGMDVITGLLNGMGIVSNFNQKHSELSASQVHPELQQGGGNSSILPYVFMGTIAIIAVSGFILTYRRSKKNVKPDDPPPEPGVFRKSSENPK